MNLKCTFRMSGESESGLCEEAEEKCIGFLAFLGECVFGARREDLSFKPLRE